MNIGPFFIKSLIDRPERTSIFSTGALTIKLEATSQGIEFSRITWGWRAPEFDSIFCFVNSLFCNTSFVRTLSLVELFTSLVDLLQGEEKTMPISRAQISKPSTKEIMIFWSINFVVTGVFMIII